MKLIHLNCIQILIIILLCDLSKTVVDKPSMVSYRDGRSLLLPIRRMRTVLGFNISNVPRIKDVVNSNGKDTIWLGIKSNLVCPHVKYLGLSSILITVLFCERLLPFLHRHGTDFSLIHIHRVKFKDINRYIILSLVSHSGGHSSFL